MRDGDTCLLQASEKVRVELFNAMNFCATSAAGSTPSVTPDVSFLKRAMEDGMIVRESAAKASRTFAYRICA